MHLSCATYLVANSDGSGSISKPGGVGVFPLSAKSMPRRGARAVGRADSRRPGERQVTGPFVGSE